LIRALIFDFDGVLAFTTPFHFAAWQTILRPHGIEPDELVMRLHEGSPAYRIVQAMARHAGVLLDDATAKEYMMEKNQVFRQISDSKPYAEIEQILDFCHRQGVVCGVATGTTMDNLRHVLGENLLNRFQTVVTDGDYLRGKPFPDPYILAAQKMNVPASACLVIENAPLGIQAAKSAQMLCIAITTTLDREHLQQADVIVASHTDLVKYLKKVIL
jgi:beta-phosphoglucomutase